MQQMLKNTEPIIGTNYWKNGMKNQKNKKRCKNALKILQAVGYLQENLANCNTKDPIVKQTRLIARSALSGC